jgi:hypothetical protein
MCLCLNVMLYYLRAAVGSVIVVTRLRVRFQAGAEIFLLRLGPYIL